MEAYSSSSSSAYLQQNNSGEAKGSFRSSIHSVRKSPAKPWNKKPIAPMPPTRPRVYKVDPINFRDLVQKLTGAEPECSSQSQRLKSVAPPPLNVAAHSYFGGDVAGAPLQLLPPPGKTTEMSDFYMELMSEISDAKTQKTSDCGMASNTVGLSLSPSSYNWRTYPLLSPGSLSTVL
ncbi:VQ motif-containing protein [Melia azedarach]|uniref:VQ motif-containing protein n=1 Tax=Melia azedarach TaxID=155640 RepID=A0ACC1XTL8_MELAZ|nr:VQ motif-containing protein [Melia azedarach]